MYIYIDVHMYTQTHTKLHAHTFTRKYRFTYSNIHTYICIPICTYIHSVCSLCEPGQDGPVSFLQHLKRDCDTALPKKLSLTVADLVQGRPA